MRYLLLISVGLLLLCSCKPTERNYQTAYEKAYEASRRKAQQAAESSDPRLEAFDAPRALTVGNDTVMVSTVLVSPFENEAPVEGAVAVAVARYGMPTNARRHLQDIRKEYPGAFIATDGEDSYYIAVCGAPSARDAVGPVAAFRASHPGYPYPGLAVGVPVIVTLGRQ